MTEEKVFRALVGAFVLTALAISGYYRQKADVAGGKISRHVDGQGLVMLQKLVGLVFLSGLVAYLIRPQWMDWARFALPAGLRWMGVVLAMAGLAGMPWLFHHLGENITPTAAVRSQARLVTSGPYRFIRHPLYTFGCLFWVGVSLTMSSWWTALFATLAFSAMAWRTPREEAALLEKFGDEYRRYAARTPRYVPSLRAVVLRSVA